MHLHWGSQNFKSSKSFHERLIIPTDFESFGWVRIVKANQCIHFLSSNSCSKKILNSKLHQWASAATHSSTQIFIRIVLRCSVSIVYLFDNNCWGLVFCVKNILLHLCITAEKYQKHDYYDNNKYLINDWSSCNWLLPEKQSVLIDK